MSATISLKAEPLRKFRRQAIALGTTSTGPGLNAMYEGQEYINPYLSYQPQVPIQTPYDGSAINTGGVGRSWQGRNQYDGSLGGSYGFGGSNRFDRGYEGAGGNWRGFGLASVACSLISVEN